MEAWGRFEGSSWRVGTGPAEMNADMKYTHFAHKQKLHFVKEEEEELNLHDS